MDKPQLRIYFTNKFDIWDKNKNVIFFNLYFATQRNRLHLSHFLPDYSHIK